MSILGGIAGNLASGSIGRAVVSLVLDTTGYNAQLEKAQAQTTGATKGMATGFDAFKGAAVAGLAIAGVAAIGFAKSAVSAAADLEESQNKVNVVFGTSADVVTAFGQTTADSFGISEQAALEASASFGNMLLSAGLAQDQVAGMSTELVGLAADLASFNNVDPTIALERLRSGLSGQARPLRAFGILMSEGAVKAEAYATGIAEAGAELTEGQKVQARYSLILKQTSTAQGDFARTSEGLANSQRILRANMEDLSATVGTSLIPVVIDLTHTLIELGNIIDLIGQKVPGAGEAMKAALTFPGLTLITDNIHKWADVLGVGTDQSDDLTVAQKAVIEATTGMSQAAYDAAAATNDLSKAQKELQDAVETAGEGILSLETTVKDTFDVSQKELQRGFNQMLQTALRFKSDMKQLDNLDIGLSPNAQARFETFMLSQGPGYIDAFVNASASKQARMVAQWSQSVNAMQAKINSLHSPTVQVNLSTAAADASLNRLKSQLARLS